MKKRRSIFLFILLLFFAVLFIGSCREKKNEDEPDQQRSGTATAPSSRLAQSTVEAVGSELEAASIAMDAEIVELIKSSAMDRIIADSLLYSTDIARVSEAALKGVMIGLGKCPDADLSDVSSDDTSVQSPNKKLIVLLLVEEFIRTLTMELSVEELVKATGNVVLSVTAQLGKAGVSPDDIALFTAGVADTALRALTEGGVSETDMTGFAFETLEKAIAGLGKRENNMTDERAAAAIEDVVASLFLPLTHSGVSETHLLNSLDPIIEAAFKGIGAADVAASSFENAGEAVKSGILQGLTESGVSNSTLNYYYDGIVSSVDSAVKDLINNQPDPVSAGTLIDSLLEALQSTDATTDSSSDLILSDEQMGAIKTRLEVDIGSAGLISSVDLKKILPVIIESSFSAILELQPEPGFQQKTDLSVSMVTAVEQYLIGKASGQEAVDLLTIIAEETLLSLPDVMTEETEVSQAMRQIVEFMNASVFDIPLGDASPVTALEAMLTAVVTSTDDISLSRDGETALVRSSLTGAVEGVDGSELNNEKRKEMFEHFAGLTASGVMKNAVERGDTSSDILRISRNSSREIILALTDAGVATSDSVGATDDIVSGISQELKDSLSSDELKQVLSEAESGAIEGLEESGATDEEKAEAEKASSEAVDSAVNETTPPTAAKPLVSDQSLVTEEASGEKGSFCLTLDKAPVSDITVSITSGDTTEGTVFPGHLLFTAENWNKKQQVWISPEDDGFVDGEVKYEIHIVSSEGVRKTLSASNNDNDKVGIDVTPSEKQYTSEAGGQAWYNVKLASQPKDTIVLRWAVTAGAKSVDIIQNRIMTFAPSAWNNPQVLKIRGKVCADCREHASVSIESQNIISLNGRDEEYPVLAPENITLMNLKKGPVIRRIDPNGSRGVTITFNDAIFLNDDDTFIYETVFENETIQLSYVPHQSLPSLIMNSCRDSDGRVRMNVEQKTDTVQSTDQFGMTTTTTTTTYSYDFCLTFYNASTSRTQSALTGWMSSYGMDSVSCLGDGSNPNTVNCTFTGSNDPITSATIGKHTVFNEYTGNAAISLSFRHYTTVIQMGGSGGGAPVSRLRSICRPFSANAADQEMTRREVQSVPSPISLFYKPITISGVKQAVFEASGAIPPGYWYMSGFSKSLLKEAGALDSSRYFYVKF